MLQYDRIDVSEVIDTNKTDSSRECIICHYWHFLKINLRLQPKLFDGWHDMTQKSTSFNDSAIATIGRNNYRINFWFMTKSEAMDSMKNTDLKEKIREL